MNRIWRPYTDWECVNAGFYNTIPPGGMSADESILSYSIFLSDLDRFESAIKRVLREWPNSCEQFLSNESMNRIAWIGQASMCIETGVPSCFKAGFRFLTNEQQLSANAMAKKYLDLWLAEKSGQKELGC